MTDKILQWDKDLFLSLNFDGGAFWDSFFWAVSGKMIWIPLYLLMLWLLYRKVGLRNALVAMVFVGVSLAISDQVCNFFKDNVPKLRPTHNPEFVGLIELVNNYRGALTGTVSAHTAVSFSIVTLTSMLIRSGWYTAGMVFWALLVAYSRIYIGAHYPLDIFFGLLLGCAVGFLSFWMYNLTTRWLDKRKSGKTREIV